MPVYKACRQRTGGNDSDLPAVRKRVSKLPAGKATSCIMYSLTFTFTGTLHPVMVAFTFLNHRKSFFRNLGNAFENEPTVSVNASNAPFHL